MLYLSKFSMEVMRLWLRIRIFGIRIFGCCYFVRACCLKKDRLIKLCQYLKPYKMTMKESSRRLPIFSVGAMYQVNVGMMLREFSHLFLNLWKVMEAKRAALIVYI